MDIKTSLLKTFIAVYEERSMSGAAKRIHIAQPAVTNRIHQLERLLETDLLDRTAKGVTPNSMGESFYLDAVNIIKKHESLKQKYTPSSDEPRGNVRVGLPYGMSTPVLSIALGKFQEQNPLVHLQLKEDGADRLHDMLIHQELDFAISSSQLYSDQVQSTFLARTEVVMISRPESHWKHMERISVSTLPPLQLVIPPSNSPVRVNFDRYLSDHDIAVKKMTEFDSYYAVIHLVQKSDWIAFGMMPKISPYKSDKSLTINPLDPPFYEDICIHQPKSVLPSKAVKLCIDLVSNTFMKHML